MKVNVYFDKNNHNKMYSYEIVAPSNPTKENYAMAISEAMVMASSKKKSRLSLDRYYHLLMQIIGNSNIFSSEGLTENKLQSSFTHAKILNDKEKPVKRNNLVIKKVWRVGLSQSNRLVIDIDSHDMDNLDIVKLFYQNLLGYSFITVKTANGFWLISDKTYVDKNEWLFDNCRILNPKLLFSEYYRYKEKLLTLDNKQHKSISEDIINSDLYHGVGKFDVIFVFINIKRQICTLRISKKTPNEVMEVIK